MQISDLKKEYFKKIDLLDLDLIIAQILKKPREFVLTHPEHQIPEFKIKNLKSKISRRRRGEPLAYILGHKEFYELDFKVDKNTLIPRPETEIMVELALEESRITNPESYKNILIVDVGTGSGNIIVSIAKTLSSDKKSQNKTCGGSDNEILASRSVTPQDDKVRYLAIDISKGTIKIAKKNAKTHTVGKKIKFLHGNLLTPLIQNSKFEIRNSRIIILANLPYLSREIYSSAPISVKKYEPKSALYSRNKGLRHYDDLLKQIKLLTAGHRLEITSFFEISPEQKKPLSELIKKHFPNSKVEFKKDLSGKWRVCKFKPA